MCKLKRLFLIVSIPAILFSLTACPGVILEHIQFGFIPGNYEGAIGVFECFSPVASDVLAYKWTFGDSSSAEGKIVTHVYSVQGEYVVQCTIVTETSVYIYTVTVSIERLAAGGVAGSVFAYYGNYVFHTIRRCDVLPFASCTTSTIVADASSGVVAPNDIKVVGNYLYWSDAGQLILRCDLTGGFPCTSTIVARAVTTGIDSPPLGVYDPQGIAVVGTTLYWANAGNNRIMSCDIGGSLPCTQFSVIADVATSGVHDPKDLLVDGSRLIWTDDASRKILSCDLTGPKPCQSQLLANMDSPITGHFGIATIAGALFWFDNNNSSYKIYACVLTSTPCTGILIADGPTSGVSNPRGLAFNGFTMYWANATEIRSCNLINAATPCLSMSEVSGDTILTNIDIK